MEDKEKIEKLKQAANIWAMIAAASFAVAIFQGSWFLGFPFGAFSVHMYMKLTEV